MSFVIRVCVYLLTPQGGLSTTTIVTTAVVSARVPLPCTLYSTSRRLKGKHSLSLHYCLCTHTPAISIPCHEQTCHGHSEYTLCDRWSTERERGEKINCNSHKTNTLLNLIEFPFADLFTLDSLGHWFISADPLADVYYISATYSRF